MFKASVRHQRLRGVADGWIPAGKGPTKELARMQATAKIREWNRMQQNPTLYDIAVIEVSDEA